MTSWPQLKLDEVGVNFQNPPPPTHNFLYPAQVKLESVRTLLEIIRLTSKKSYLVISNPIHMISWPNYNLGQVGFGSNIVQNHLSDPQEVISGHYLPPIQMTSLPKLKLG